MNFKRTLCVTQDKNERDLDDVKEYPTLADLMREQNTSQNNKKSVHHRRDLDSIG